jgi:enoyl-CoA hydratase/carnithine racemase
MDILCDVRNHIAFITLNRPAALNALSLNMVIELRAALHRCAADPGVRAVLIKGAGEKAFCAGGDIRALYDSHRNAGRLHVDFFATEYPLDYVLHSYPKPYIALVNGLTLGGGMGIAQGSRLRIAGDRTRMAMPEVAIGFFPDVGASYFLSRLDGSLGLYLALTGVQIRAADCVYAGLADYYLPPAAADGLEATLNVMAWSERATDPAVWHDQLRTVIQKLVADPGAATLAPMRAAIELHFAADSVPALIASLEQECRSEYQAWAQQSLQLMSARSPTMLSVAMKQLRLGRSMTLAQCLRMEIGMAARCFTQGDFVEGVRAMIIDKDNKPLWRPNHLADVTPESVDAIFQDPWVGAIHPLADLETIQA